MITIEDIFKEFPGLKTYEKQPDVVRQMYARLHPKVGLEGLQVGEAVNGESILLVDIINESSYVGCPICYGRADVDEGIVFTCKTGGKRTNGCHDEQRVATRLFKTKMAGSDPSTKVILDFPPFGYKIVDPAQYLGKVVNVKGRVTEMDKSNIPIIRVLDMKVVSDIRATETKLPATPQVVSVEVPAKPAPPAVPEEKKKALILWIKAVKPTTEEQIKNHVVNNLKLKWEDAKPIVEGLTE
jgi:hypothetical protein